MSLCKRSRIILMLVLMSGILALDFFSKAYIYALFSRGTLASNVHSFLGIDFSLALTSNYGAAWGFFSDFQIPLLVVRITIICGLCIYLIAFNKNRALQLPFCLILAGVIGNIIDFFRYGFVVDFLRFDFWGYHYPVFNFADSAITIGVIWLGLAWRAKKRILSKKI